MARTGNFPKVSIRAGDISIRAATPEHFPAHLGRLAPLQLRRMVDLSTHSEAQLQCQGDSRAWLMIFHPVASGEGAASVEEDQARPLRNTSTPACWKRAQAVESERPDRSNPEVTRKHHVAHVLVMANEQGWTRGREAWEILMKALRRKLFSYIARGERLLQRRKLLNLHPPAGGGAPVDSQCGARSPLAQRCYL